jgi:PAS domain S-box-containing protein
MNSSRSKTQSIILYFDAQPDFLRYGVAVLAVAIGAIATCVISVIGERAAFLLFFFTIAQTAFWLGLNPGLFAMILSLIAVNVLVLFPAHISAHDLWVLNAGFCFVSVGMIVTTSFHRRSTAALWESRQDLDFAQKVGQIGSWRLNVHRNELRWSSENYRIFGIPKGTPQTYETFLSIVHPDDREYVDHMWQAGLRGAPYDIEHRLIVAGEVKWVREKAVLEFSKKGKLLGGFGITQDITRYKHNELALQESRQRYAGIVESALDAIITIDAEQRITLFNAAAEKMFACKAEEAVGESIERFIPERFRAVHKAYVRAFESFGLTSRKMGESASVWGLRANGEEFPVEATISQCEINGEKSFTAILRDVTELKRFQDSLIKSQAQLRTFIEQAPIGIAMFDRNMNYLVTSRRWIEEFGRGYDDLTGHNHYVVNPDISAEWKQVHAKAQGGEFLKNDDDLWIQADGSRHWVRWVAYPWTDQQGEIGGIIIAYEDITARRMAEEELYTAQTRLALVVEEVKAGYWDWDLNTDSVYLSPEWKRQIGFEENELLNQWEEWECRLHPDDQAWVLEATDNYIAGLLPVFELEFRLRHKDGLYRWIHTRGALLRDHNNRPFRMLGINLDITHYKRQKELRERRDKMEQSVRLYAVTQTAAAIAHELHQPLAAISSYSEVALHMLRAGNWNPEKLSPIMDVCAQQAQRAGGVIRQLMTVLHEDDSLSELIDINFLAREALDLVKANGSLDGFNVELELAAGLPPVRGNSLQIEKVLVNLLSNSLESMRENGMSAGTVTVTTRCADEAPAMIQVTVGDEGKCETDSATLKNMFQPFYRVKPYGSGMDLAISRALVEAHGGKMWAEQTADAGICIHFTLPAAS